MKISLFARKLSCGITIYEWLAELQTVICQNFFALSSLSPFPFPCSSPWFSYMYSYDYVMHYASYHMPSNTMAAPVAIDLRKPNDVEERTEVDKVTQ